MLRTKMHLKNYLLLLLHSKKKQSLHWRKMLNHQKIACTFKTYHFFFTLQKCWIRRFHHSQKRSRHSPSPCRPHEPWTLGSTRRVPSGTISQRRSFMYRQTRAFSPLRHWPTNVSRRSIGRKRIFHVLCLPPSLLRTKESRRTTPPQLEGRGRRHRHAQRLWSDLRPPFECYVSYERTMFHRFYKSLGPNGLDDDGPNLRIKGHCPKSRPHLFSFLQLVIALPNIKFTFHSTNFQLIFESLVYNTILKIMYVLVTYT